MSARVRLAKGFSCLRPAIEIASVTARKSRGGARARPRVSRAGWASTLHRAGVALALRCAQRAHVYRVRLLEEKSWSRARRVSGKAEVLSAGDNPRFIVTNLPTDGFKGDADRARFSTTPLNEEFFCARGEMANVLKQQVLDLEADTLGTHFLASNQLRLWLGSFAYFLMEWLRAWGCHGSELERATVPPPAPKAIQSGGAGDCQRTAGVSPTQQCLSAAGLVSPLSRAADAADAGRRLTTRTPDEKTARDRPRSRRAAGCIRVIVATSPAGGGRVAEHPADGIKLSVQEAETRLLHDPFQALGPRVRVNRIQVSRALRRLALRGRGRCAPQDHCHPAAGALRDLPAAVADHLRLSQIMVRRECLLTTRVFVGPCGPHSPALRQINPDRWVGHATVRPARGWGLLR